MKNTYLIIGGGIAVLLLLAIWAYLLIYGTPKPLENFFTDFNFNVDSPAEPMEPLIPEIPTGQVDTLSEAPLRQLTTKPVIGFKEVSRPDGATQTVLYAEAGTGHVFSIDLATGMEIRLSNITIPNAQTAQFSHDGTLVAIRSGYGNQNSIELLTLAGENNATQETLLPRMVDFDFNYDNKILYSEFSSSGLLGREFDTKTSISRTIFSVPFQNASIVWSKNTSTPHFVYPKPSARLPGFLYRISNGVIIREQASGPGLTALANDSYYIHTITTTRGPVSFVTNRITGNTNSLPIIVQPEKCVFSSRTNNMIYCGFDNNHMNHEFPDNWYKGLVSFADTLWEIDVERGLAAKLIDTEQETGRVIDTIGMDMSTQDRVLYFINKNDNTLWMYEI